MNRGVSSIEVRKHNRNRVFRYVNSKEKTSMPDIATALDMSLPTVLQLVKELKEAQVIQEVGEFDSTGGRKAKAIAAIRQVKYAVGVEITRNHISLVLTDLSEKVLNHIRIRRPFVYEDTYFRRLGETVEKFLETGPEVKGEILGVGLSVPCIIDSSRNYITNSHALGLHNISCDEFSKYIPYPCMLLNDANAAAIAEYMVNRSAEGMVYLSVCNTVGGAIVFRKDQGAERKWDPFSGLFENMYSGEHWHSAEFGHMVIHPGGRTCYCGKKGCLDAYCSALLLAEHTEGNLELFFEEMERGNAKYAAVWNEFLDNLAIAVDNLQMCFDCDVVLGGYVGNIITPYIEELRERLTDKNIFEHSGKYVRACRYQMEASALGAAVYHVEKFMSSI